MMGQIRSGERAIRENRTLFNAESVSRLPKRHSAIRDLFCLEEEYGMLLKFHASKQTYRRLFRRSKQGYSQNRAFAPTGCGQNPPTLASLRELRWRKNAPRHGSASRLYADCESRLH